MNIQQMLVPEERVFIDHCTPKWVVLHKTAGGSTVQALYDFFKNDVQWRSSHYGIGLDGSIAQYVLEKDGAAGNCCTDKTGESFLQEFNQVNGNLNWYTISIEHIDTRSDNQSKLTFQQKIASLELIHDICVRHKIPFKRGDSTGGILIHKNICSTVCPGNFPFQQILDILDA